MFSYELREAGSNFISVYNRLHSDRFKNHLSSLRFPEIGLLFLFLLYFVVFFFWIYLNWHVVVLKKHHIFICNANIPLPPNGIIYGFDVDKLLLLLFEVLVVGPTVPIYARTHSFAYAKDETKPTYMWFDTGIQIIIYYYHHRCRRTDSQGSCPPSIYNIHRDSISNENIQWPTLHIQCSLPKANGWTLNMNMKK